LLAASIFGASRQAWSQTPQPPDLQMLLNLDLFAAPAGGPASDDAPPGGSLLEQIRALRQMGYIPSNPDQQEPPLPPPGVEPRQPLDDLMQWLPAPLGGAYE